MKISDIDLGKAPFLYHRRKFVRIRLKAEFITVTYECILTGAAHKNNLPFGKVIYPFLGQHLLRKRGSLTKFRSGTFCRPRANHYLNIFKAQRQNLDGISRLHPSLQPLQRCKFVARSATFCTYLFHKPFGDIKRFYVDFALRK